VEFITAYIYFLSYFLFVFHLDVPTELHPYFGLLCDGDKEQLYIWVYSDEMSCEKFTPHLNCNVIARASVFSLIFMVSEIKNF
jgi:hypothetical protein